MRIFLLGFFPITTITKTFGTVPRQLHTTLRFSGPSPLSGQNPPPRTTFDPAYVRGLFNGIARRYDLLNHLLSSGIDILWRRKAVHLLRGAAPRELLDVATGTADLAIEAARQLERAMIVGIDVAENMLTIGREKIRRRGLQGRIVLDEASAERLPYPEGSFDAVLCGFGVRNFSDLSAGLKEMYRVLRPGGSVVILEFSRPSRFPIRPLYDLYSGTVLPAVGRWISRHRDAYAYLPGTIRTFPFGAEFLGILASSGFHSLNEHSLTFGIASIYHGIK
jgi:demethylmenaquinone methyltransferase/2-methoxy-6-polyprenyl-1,4-benzoquinol methylase